MSSYVVSRKTDLAHFPDQLMITDVVCNCNWLENDLYLINDDHN